MENGKWEMFISLYLISFTHFYIRSNYILVHIFKRHLNLRRLLKSNWPIYLADPVFIRVSGFKF